MNFWKRLKEGFEHILKLDDPPHKIALGFAIGIFVAFTPFWGLHIILASILAWIFRVKARVAAIATLLCNPWTMPFIYGGSLIVGNQLVDGNSSINMSYIVDFADQLGEALLAFDRAALKSFFYDLLTVGKSLVIGSFVLGTISAVISYLIILNTLKNSKMRNPNPQL